MFKFFCRLIFLCALTQCAFSSSNYNGIYIGGAFGGSILDGTSTFDMETQLSFNKIAGINLIIDDHQSMQASSHNHAAFGSFNIGYGFNYEWLFTGLEFSVSRSLYTLNYTNNITSRQHNESPDVISFLITSKNLQNNYTVDPTQVGIDLRPGYIFKKKGLLYARLGIARASVAQTASLANIDQIQLLAESPTNYYFSLPLVSAKTSSIYGVRFGGGFEYLIFPQCSLRLDYIFTQFNNPGPNVTKSSTATITNPEAEEPGTISSTFSSSLKSITDNVITLGINYYFSKDSWLN